MDDPDRDIACSPRALLSITNAPLILFSFMNSSACSASMSTSSVLGSAVMTSSAVAVRKFLEMAADVAIGDRADQPARAIDDAGNAEAHRGHRR